MTESHAFTGVEHGPPYPSPTLEAALRVPGVRMYKSRGPWHRREGPEPASFPSFLSVRLPRSGRPHQQMIRREEKNLAKGMNFSIYCII